VFVDVAAVTQLQDRQVARLLCPHLALTAAAAAARGS
jgi:hypothetical protein